MLSARLRVLALAVPLLAASTPLPVPNYAATPARAAIVATTPGSPPGSPRLIAVATNVVGDYAVVTVAYPGDSPSMAILVKHFTFGWQAIDRAGDRELASRGIAASDRATLLSGVATIAVSRQDGAYDLVDRGPAADIAAIREQVHSASSFWSLYVAVSGDFAVVDQPKTQPLYFRRTAGTWKRLIGGNSDESAPESAFHAVGLSDQTLCALERCRYFHSPTGNTGCVDRELHHDGPGGLIGTPTYVFRCDVVDGLVPSPASAQSSCRSGSARGYELGQSGAPSVVCAGDSVLDRGAVLDYDRSWQELAYGNYAKEKAGISCTSRSSGLTCTNESGHGFFIARGESHTF